MKKLISFLAILLCLTLGFAYGCGGNDDSTGGGSNPNSSQQGGSEVVEETPTICPVEYIAEAVEDIDAWAWELMNNSGTITNKATTMPGIVVSPYFEMTVNDVAVPVYVERTARGPHSFAYVDLDGLSENAKFTLNVSIITHKKRANPVVLPESAGVTATVKGYEVTSQIKAYGTYTYTFDRGIDYADGSEIPLTVMVKQKEKYEVPAGYTVQEITPGTYNYEQTNFETQNTVYYFKRGLYIVESIAMPSNSVFYFEEGTVLRAIPQTLDANGNGLGRSILAAKSSGENIKVYGRAAIDLAMSHGSNSVYKEDKGTPSTNGVIISFDYVTNAEFAGFNIVNSNSWTCCFTGCVDVVVRDLILIGYRTYSDGVMIADCTNVNVSGCFVRTGDDALEVKSNSTGLTKLQNVVFENNAVWTDKGIAYGAVYENAQNRQGVTWRNNSVGFALANWSNHLGCTTISMYGHNVTEDSDMHFENIEIYTTYCPVTTIVLHEGGIVKNIYFKNITAKYINLNPDRYRGAIDFMVYNSDNGDIEDFSIKNIYFDNINLAGTMLTNENKKTLITTDFAEGFDDIFGDYRYVRVNTLG